MWNPFHPQPAPPAFGEDKVVPETTASPISRLLFSWLDSFLSVGFSRPLEKADFWQLPNATLTDALTERVEEAFYKRCPPEERPAFILQQTGGLSEDGPVHDDNVSRQTSNSTKHAPTPDKLDSEKQPAPQTPEQPSGKKPKYDSSLVKALYHVYIVQLWTSGLLKLFSDTLNTTTPLVNQVLLTWLTKSFVYFKATDAEREALGLQKPQGIGYGIGLAFAIFAMQEVSSLLSNHYQMVAMTNGLCIRTSLIGAIFRKSLRLSGRGRMKHSVGQITTMISTDATRLDRNSAMIHNLWIAPIQIAIGVGLLIRNLGVSALVGLAVLIIGFPAQFMLAKIMFAQRKKGVVLTDQRVRMTTEVLSGIRLLKYYAWEQFYAHQVGVLREREVSTIRRLAAARSSLIGLVTVIPIFASILSFITYALTNHTLDVATIFSSLQFFNIIRTPLIYLPLVLASATDALVALRRISAFLLAEELAVPYVVAAESKFALNVDADFTWEAARKEPGAGMSKAARHKAAAEAKASEKRLSGKGKKEPVLPMVANGKEKEQAEEKEEKPFELKDVKLKIPKGSFVAIVGRVGSGKSSLLQALIGEMRKTRGECTFSSTAAYVPQSAWIMNATLRQNIVFGQPEDDAKFHEIIKACCLEPDLEMLPNGDETEIGEKGINLSGGQKARVSLARAAFSGADIVLMDDSLSAVDAYVGKQLLDRCLLNGPLADKTRVLVTHALHVLDKTDYVYVMDEGVIVEQGTYQDLMDNGQMFSRLMEEYGSLDKQEEAAAEEEVPEVLAQVKGKAAAPEKAHQTLMQEEERLTGAVAASVYTKYFKYAGGVTVFPLIMLFLVLSQGAQVANNLFLGFWTSQSVKGFDQGDYMGTYAALGIASGVFSFALSLTISMASLTAGLRMFKAALIGVLRSSVAFFDTTPLGRIMSRLSKDQDTVDAELAMIAVQLLSTASSVVGTAALVFYTFPYLGIIFVPLMTLYYIAAVYYRRSSVEAKRLDSLLRSALYSSYSETLTGLSTVRAYRSQDRFIRKSEDGLDLENRAYYMTIAIQRWLGVRLDILGNILILGICLFAAGFRSSVDPSKIGVVLSYTLSITQTFSLLVSTYAQNEQNFNAVERILYYTELPNEGAATTPNDPPPTWPHSGEIAFKDVEMAYRPGLPLVLKGVSFYVKPGEKVGIVGRTGAGKSSLLQALFRIVNVQSGHIEIDGQNIADIGLDTLRGRLALVPQDSLLFKGTLRENLDPTNTRTDAELIDSLRRAWLLPRDGSTDPVAEAKFSLSSNVSDEGSNYSAGEKQLVALCRALVKNSRIIVLDEATSSVDVETDAKVQRTIQTEFSASTLLCIAHRLNTIVYYDRILVMDAGRVAEFDTPLALFDKEDSIFRSLCNEANLSRADVLKIRATVHGQLSVPASSAASAVHQEGSAAPAAS
ncbi:multidrug resistance-associated ABC transporter [Trametes versicolor FP-101664 SS1]|uniref:multidrug resistance-associated ABC transporter n=1 Tax=Trametes versicolor (strain FP-101664) TaxID=717944 RepID=UPI0004621801|nr:multidrug resistance-associated ABC transporter [Trametes versicolor FP-101664 SS1]EIW55759.1 multidrug resistance-associated ABC transporter [Trametes versicolor FP-101664 SS1]